MMKRTLLTVTALVLVAGCGSDSEPTAKKTTEKPAADIPAREFPTEWADSIDNPWLPLAAGAKWTYEKKTADGVEDVVVKVTNKTKTVDGVETTVVSEKVSEDGELIDDTKTWYAQDAEGNVWILGETTETHEDGKVETEGWETGVDGAEAGIAMLAEPKVGDVYQQMYYEGEAEDRAEVISVDETVEGPVDSWSGVLQTEDTTPLEPEVEHKWYAKDVGPVQQHTIKGEKETVVLTKYRKP
jgi:hypothetical protein